MVTTWGYRGKSSKSLVSEVGKNQSHKGLGYKYLFVLC